MRVDRYEIRRNERLESRDAVKAARPVRRGDDGKGVKSHLASVLPYFLGLSEYSDKAPFDASMLVHFRKRVNLELIGQINEALVQQHRENDTSKQEGTAESSDSTDEDNRADEPPSASNAGQLIVDASCTPADIRYPTDLSLLNEAQEQTERIIDLLYAQVREQVAQKPRTYRCKARQ